ncbi:MAG: ribosome maturation factor RimM [Vulcanimicrobiaceae bacterium]
MASPSISSIAKKRPRRPTARQTKTPTELAIARLVGTFGLRGELKCDPTTAGRAAIVTGVTLVCGRERARHEIVIAHVREHARRLLVTLHGIDSLEAAQPYIGETLYAAPEQIPLLPGEYLDADLIGCLLYDDAGTELGSVERVDHFPASDMLVVGGKMVPMVQAFIRSIDLAKRRIDVDLPAGLLE